MKCQRIDPTDPSLACDKEATHQVEVYDKMLRIKTEAELCDEHFKEYNVQSATARTSPRKRKTTNF